MTTNCDSRTSKNLEIKVPNNYFAVLTYNNKVKYQLPQGDYTINDQNYPNLFFSFKKQNGNKQKIKIILKTYNYLIHYISFNEFKINVQVKRRITLNNAKTKIIFPFEFCLRVEDIAKFMEFILLECYYATKSRTEKLIKFYIEEYLIKILTKRNYTEALSKEDLDILKVKLTEYLQKVGLKLMEINQADLVVKTKNKEEETSNTEDVERLKENPKNVGTENSLLTNNSLSQSNIKYCPKCQTKQIQNAEYCHICGYKFSTLSTKTITVDQHKEK